MRTFPLIALLGRSAALLADVTGAWVFVAIVGIVGVLIAIAFAIDAYQGKVSMTTEIAVLVVFVCGARCCRPSLRCWWWLRSWPFS